LHFLARRFAAKEQRGAGMQNCTGGNVQDVGMKIPRRGERKELLKGGAAPLVRFSFSYCVVVWGVRARPVLAVDLVAFLPLRENVRGPSLVK
jgi:hypothetical protein